MIAFSSRGMYAVAAMYELALSFGEGHKQIRDIAAAHHMPEDYLRQLMIMLKRAKLVESVRGVRGGYRLAKIPSQITIRSILECMDGTLRMVPIQPEDEVLAAYWKRRLQLLEHLFDTTIEELTHVKQSMDNRMNYTI